MRVEIIEKTVYPYEELSDGAKAKAREWFVGDGEGGFEFDAEYIYEYASRMGKLMGIDLDTKRVTLMGGGHRYDPCIWYSGFWNQDDGACFEGTYRYKKGGIKAVSDECGGTDKELIRIAQGLQDVQRRNFYRLTATTSHRGHYYHSGCMHVEVEDSENRYRDLSDDESDVRQLLRDFADWIYYRLEAAYEYRVSDEAAEEGILANQYEFDESGSIHCCVSFEGRS